MQNITHTDEQLAYYRNPEYWDGYSLGENGPDTVKFTVDNSLGAVMRAGQDVAFARQSLRTKLNAMHTYWPDNTLQPGEIFDPNNYSPGTVVSLCKEDITITRNARLPLTRYDYSEASVPERNTCLPSLEPQSTNAQRLRSPSLLYCTLPRWGVVVPAANTKILLNVYDRFVSCVNGEPKILPVFLQTTPDTFPVNSVIGSVRGDDKNVGKPSIYSLARFTHVHIFEQETKKRRQWRVLQKLSKLAIGQLPPRVSGAEG